MILQIPYGKDDELSIELADQLVAEVIEPRTVEIGDQSETIRQAVSNPVGPQSIEDFLADAQNVLVIVNDATRPTPTRQVLDVLVEMFNGVDVDFLVATGIHRAPTEEEYLQIFGQGHYERFRDRIFAHDSRRSEDMVFLGRSKNGTEMRVNRRGVEAHKIIIISSVEPHYFAGYTGGRKSFLPGIAAYETIEQNHKLALKPEAKALALEGNPVHEDMIDALKTVKPEIFAINTVLDKKHRIYAAVAGDINESFLAATHLANEIFAAPISQKADIVVSVVKFPGDIDLYQAQKGIDNAKHALKEGGILILVAKCRCGVGEESFVNLLSSASSPRDVLERIEKKYLLGYHKAAKMAEVGLWAETWAVTDLEPDMLEKIFIRPCSSLQAALDDALHSKGLAARVLFLLDGGLTVPILEKQT
ncbi:MAG: nickel-dependent lactate racemase [Deltaproteobacteria bacterium]|nr:nickel-dependent lactate racemase [Deltaproteobacteria bacterium]